MYIVTVEFEIAPDKFEAFRVEMLSQARNSVMLEEDCHQFDVCFDPERPACCFLYEKYENKAAFDHHLATDHFTSFNAKVTPWVLNKDVTTWLNCVSEPNN